MSKTAQRKRDAYDKGYRAGRYGEWDNECGYRFRVQACQSFDRGRADGRLHRAADNLTRRTFWQCLKFIFGRGCA